MPRALQSRFSSGRVAIDAVQVAGTIAAELFLAPVRLLRMGIEVALEFAAAASVAGILELPFQLPELTLFAVHLPQPSRSKQTCGSRDMRTRPRPNSRDFEEPNLLFLRPTDRKFCRQQEIRPVLTGRSGESCSRLPQGQLVCSW